MKNFSCLFWIQIHKDLSEELSYWKNPIQPQGKAIHSQGSKAEQDFFILLNILSLFLMAGRPGLKHNCLGIALINFFWLNIMVSEKHKGLQYKSFWSIVLR